MAHFMLYSIHFCFLIYLVTVSYGQAENTSGPKRTKWSPYSGLVPFLRIGRSRLQAFPGEGELGEDTFKRSKPVKTMMAFPRVGRSDAMEYREDGRNAQKKSATSTMNNGLWFGPRLGRIHKRQEYKQDVPMAYLYFGDYTPRLGRESEEILEDGEAVPEDQEIEKSVPETA